MPHKGLKFCDFVPQLSDQIIYQGALFHANFQHPSLMLYCVCIGISNSLSLIRDPGEVFVVSNTEQTRVLPVSNSLYPV